MSPDQRLELDIITGDPYTEASLLLVETIKAIRASTLSKAEQHSTLIKLEAQLECAASITAIRAFNADCRQAIARLGGAR